MIESYFQSILDTASLHPYIFIFVGLIFAGEAVLLPAVYFALAGKLSMPYVVAVAVAATTLADLAWYYVGLHMKDRFYGRLVNARVKKGADMLSGAFMKRSSVVLYFSKFVYGVRVAAQILAGSQRMPLRRYLSVNFLGILSLTVFIALLAYSIEFSLSNLTDLVHGLEVAFLVFVAFLVAAHLILGALFKRTWSQR
ncbi:MAG: VTT domain-containing protein [Candidatus Taylorbacteria bacterium]|nr:VTT domain-containing protein [Candidatus Taylorbacteria bacterium]